MQPTFIYDKIASGYHERERNLAIDYEKIAVSNGKIVLKKNINEEIEDGTRHYQNNMTLNKATITSKARFFDKTFLNCENLERASIYDENLIDISNAFRNTKITRCFFYSNLRNISFAYCNTNITEANFSAPYLIEMKGAFQDCRNLEEVNITNLVRLRSANYAFCDCGKLTSIHLEMPEATEIISMFSGCVSLKDVYLQSKGTRCFNLFQGCQELTNVHLEFINPVISLAMMFKDSGIESYKIDFDTSKTVYFTSMFENCKYLTSVDLSEVSTESANNYYRMFYDCSSLTNLDLTTFDFGHVDPVLGLTQFLDGTKLRKLKIKSKWFSYTYYDAKNYIGKIANLYQIPFYITEIDEEEDNLILTLSEKPTGNENTTQIRGIKTYGRLPIQRTLEEAIQNASIHGNTITISEDLSGDITDLDFEIIKFSNCKLLNVNFHDLPCQRIEFDNAKIELVSFQKPLFKDMENLEVIKGLTVSIIYLNDNEYVESYDREEYSMFENCENIIALEGITSITPQYIDFPNQYLFIELDKLERIETFRLNKDRNEKLPYGEYCYIVTPSVRFIDTFEAEIRGADIREMFNSIERINTLKVSGDCERLFYNIRSLKTIGDVFISTENRLRANCTQMFARCSKLESINSLVVMGDSRYMFYRCSSLKTINSIKLQFIHSKQQIDEWYLDNMFDGCEALEISEQNFEVDERLVPIMLIYANYMFRDCPINAVKILTKLFCDISDAKRPFLYINYACRNTAVENVSDLVLKKPTKVYANYLFSDCKGIKDVHLTLSNAASINGLFYGCENLETVTYLNIKNDYFDSLNSMFRGCENLRTINKVLFNKENIFDAGYLFYGCKSLVDYGYLDMAKCINLKEVTGIFAHNIHLKTYIHLPEMVLHTSYAYFDTSIETLDDINLPVTDSISYMFAECKNLTKVRRLSVKNAEVEGVFNDCENLERVGILDIQTSLNNEKSNDMFRNCPKLNFVGLSRRLHLTTLEGQKTLYHEWANSKAANCKVFIQSTDNLDVFEEVEPDE